VFWDVERYTPPPGMESPFPNRAQRYVPRGVAARQIDHVTVATADPGADAEWYRDTLGHRFMEYTVIPDRPDFPVFCMTTANRRHRHRRHRDGIHQPHERHHPDGLDHESRTHARSHEHLDGHERLRADRVLRSGRDQRQPNPQRGRQRPHCHLRRIARREQGAWRQDLPTHRRRHTRSCARAIGASTPQSDT